MKSLRCLSAPAQLAVLFMTFLLFSSLSTRQGVAQTYLDATGVPNFSTQFPIENGFINISNGNLHLEINLPEAAQRGNVSLNSKFIYDSRIWQIQGGYSWQPTQNIPADATLPARGGWRFSDAFSGVISPIYHANYCTVMPTPPNYGNPQQYVASYDEGPYYWFDPQGTQHVFGVGVVVPPSTPPPANCQSQNGTVPLKLSGDAVALDGSGYHLYINYNQGITTILDKSGNQVCCGVVQDSNGNGIYQNGSAVGITDTSNRKPVLFSSSGNNYYFDVLGFNGARNRYTVTTETINVNTNFQQSAVTEYAGTLVVVSSIQLPDGTSYQFQYDSGTSPGHYGEVTQMTLPTGGVINYGYSVFNDSYQNANHWLTSRATSDGIWYFTPSVLTQCAQNGTGCQEKVTVTAPPINGATNDTVYTQTLVGGSWNTKVDHWSGSSQGGGSLMTTTSSALNFNQTDSTLFQFLTKRVDTTTLSDVNLTQSDESDYDTTAGATLLAQKHFDYVPCSGGVPNREIDYTYDNRAGFISANILAHVHQMTQYECGNKKQQMTYGYDETAVTPTSGLPQHVSVSGSRGNLTSVQTWLDTSNTALTTSTFTYDDAGAVLTSTDISQQSTTYGHDSTDSYVTSTTPPTPSSGVPLVSTATYDFSTGLPLTSTDPNGGVSSVTSYDAFMRPNESFKPNGERTFYAYSANQVGVDEVMGVSGTQDVQTLFDGYGRKSRVAVGNGQSTNPYYQVDYCYNATGQLQFQSTRYQGNGWGTPKQCSGSGTSYSYDALNRPTAISSPDGTVSYTYTGRAVKETDANGVQKITQTDSLGRTMAVCEISSNVSMPGSGAPQPCGLDIAGTGFFTNYQYDLPTHKVTVTQGAQTRVFQTDSLGRPILTQEPESGQTTYAYAYNSTGLVVTRQRPRANQTNPSVLTTTTTQYDSLDRPVSVGYDDGTPNMAYTYDKSVGWADIQTNLKGKLSGAAGGGASWAGIIFGYDSMGRITMTVQCLPGRCGDSPFDVLQSYSYDLGGNQTKSSYYMNAHSGTEIDTNYTFSPAREILSISNTLTGAANDSGSILSTVQNGPFGPTNYNFGNGLNGIDTYDNMGRLYGNWVCNGSSEPTCTGGTQLYGNLSNQQGLRVNSIVDTILNTAVNFGYDEFNRLTSSNYSSWNTSFSYVYDRYGNRWSQNVTQGSGPSPQLSFNTANNQIVGYSYDAAGNLLSDGLHSYTYDAEGNVLQVDGGATATYVYDALNHRVHSVANGVSRGYTYNLDGQRSTVWDGASSTPSLISATTYWNGRPIAIYNGATYFQHQDVHGTERLETASDGSEAGRYTNFAFGDGATVSGTDNDPYHFAQLDHDSESGTDHAQFRQYSPTQGRWMSPDPYNGSYDPSNPQSFNRYSYVGNMPLSLTDPLGLQPSAPFYDGTLGCWTTWDNESSTLRVVSCASYGSSPNSGGGGVASGGGNGGGGGASKAPTQEVTRAPNNPQKVSDAQMRCESGVIGASMVQGIGGALGVGIPGSDPAGDVASAVKNAATSPVVQMGAGAMAAQLGKSLLSVAGAEELGAFVGEKLIPGVGWVAAGYATYSAFSSGFSYYRANITGCAGIH